VRRRIFKNIGWKIGGIILALALWFHLTTEGQFHQELNIDIEYIGVPQSMILAADSEKSAIVELTANGKRLFKILYFEDLKIVIDLSDFTSEGSYSIEFNEEQLIIPSGHNGVEIKFVAPLACDFTLVDKSRETLEQQL
jgi:hypothetical protein